MDSLEKCRYVDCDKSF